MKRPFGSNNGAEVAPGAMRTLVGAAGSRVALDPRSAPLGVDANAAHRRQVDHQPVLRNVR
jgi:hypothetical protein